MIKVHPEISSYLNSIDTAYGHRVATTLGTFRSNETLGFRNVGSQAEHDAAAYLEKEMTRIGLTQIKTYRYTAPAWEFKHAVLKVDSPENSVSIDLSAYPCHIDTQGPMKIELVDVGRANADTMKRHNVEGKWVLMDINQREDWWVNYPATEAFFQGALGVILVQDGGYGEISDASLNCQNTSIPKGAAALSISKHDATFLRSILSDQTTLTLDVLNSLTENGEALNVFGCIEGSSEEVVLMTAHYDVYFTGFQDNSIAVGLMLGIAKALVDSKIRPQKTLMFGALSAEEWGATNTRYDWLTGSYTQMKHLTPEWSRLVFANINFELPAMLEDGVDWIRSSDELARYLEQFVDHVPNDKTVYPEGIKILTPIETWSDDFSFEIFGIPSVVSALKPKFAASHYHSQLDDTSTYNEGAFKFHHVLYGMLMLQYDGLDILPLDFGARFKKIDTLVDYTLVEELVSDASLKKTLRSIQSLSEETFSLLLNNDVSMSVKEQVKDLFAYITSKLIMLSWEDDVLYPFEQSQTNIQMLRNIINHPEKADAWIKSIDNNVYYYNWSQETVNYHTQNVIAENREMMWGTGKTPTHCDLYDYIQTRDIQLIHDALRIEEERFITQIQKTQSTAETVMEILKNLK